METLEPHSSDLDKHSRASAAKGKTARNTAEAFFKLRRNPDSLQN
jgi:hypothetical protein